MGVRERKSLPGTCPIQDYQKGGESWEAGFLGPSRSGEQGNLGPSEPREGRWRCRGHTGWVQNETKGGTEGRLPSLDTADLSQELSPGERDQASQAGGLRERDRWTAEARVKVMPQLQGSDMTMIQPPAS